MFSDGEPWSFLSYPPFFLLFVTENLCAQHLSRLKTYLCLKKRHGNSEVFWDNFLFLCCFFFFLSFFFFLPSFAEL